MRVSARRKLVPAARVLRREMTTPERILWRALRDRALAGAKFRRQLPLGPYVLDFAVLEQRLAIEIDGDTHAEPAHAAGDTQRTAWLVERGWRVLRFTNREVTENREGVLVVIGSALEHPHPCPLPQARDREPAPSPALAGEGRGEGR